MKLTKKTEDRILATVPKFQKVLAVAKRGGVVSMDTTPPVAMGAGITRSMMTAYLKGQEIPPYDEADRIAELVGTTAEWLLHGRHPGQPRL